MAEAVAVIRTEAKPEAKAPPLKPIQAGAIRHLGFQYAIRPVRNSRSANSFRHATE
jgi:hypothetical protein